MRTINPLEYEILHDALDETPEAAPDHWYAPAIDLAHRGYITFVLSAIRQPTLARVTPFGRLAIQCYELVNRRVL